MSRRSPYSVLIVILLGMLVAACASPAPQPSFPPITFDHLAPIRLDVAQVEAVSDYGAPLRPPHVDHLFPVPPEVAARRWAAERLRAAGPDRRARVVVKDASVVEVELPRTRGVRGMFTRDQAERYDAVLEVEVEILDLAGNREAAVSARAERSRTVPEGISLADRERVWHDMTRALITDVNMSLERSIRETFARYVL